jgi:hypothetical protein
MSEFDWTVTIVGVAMLFYVIIPAVGVFQTRHRWRVFRARLLESVSYPVLDRTVSGEFVQPRRVWFLGRLESVQENDTVWLERDGVSVALDLSGTPIVLVPSRASIGGDLPDETPQTTTWHEITAMVEGTTFFVAGDVVSDSAIRFVPRGEQQPYVLVFDGSPTTLVARALWTGRQRNEYWNHLTPGSLVGGFLALLLIAISTVSIDRILSVTATVLAVVPILPLFPPGVVGFYFYRRIWRRARRDRARRDVIGLPEIINEATGAGDRVYRIGSENDEARAITIGIDEYGRSHTTRTWETWVPTGPRATVLPVLHRPRFDATIVSALDRAAYRRESFALLLFAAGLAVNALVAAAFLVLAVF